MKYYKLNLEVKFLTIFRYLKKKLISKIDKYLDFMYHVSIFWFRGGQYAARGPDPDHKQNSLALNIYFLLLLST